MCRIDNGDDSCQILSDKIYKSRKEHKCSECSRVIFINESYSSVSTVFDGRFVAYKTCSHCIVVQDWLNKTCGGYEFRGVLADIQEHIYDGYTEECNPLADGMIKRWSDGAGGLMPIPIIVAQQNHQE